MDPDRDTAPQRELDDLVEELEARLDACFLDELRELFDQERSHRAPEAPARVPVEPAFA